MGRNTGDAMARRTVRRRLSLLTITLATTPFYCMGFILLALRGGITPRQTSVTVTPTTSITITATRTVQASITPVGNAPTNTPGSGGLLPTPGQVGIPTNRPVFPTFTPYIPPTAYPTFTPFPSPTENIIIILTPTPLPPQPTATTQVSFPPTSDPGQVNPPTPTQEVFGPTVPPAVPGG